MFGRNTFQDANTNAIPLATREAEQQEPFARSEDAFRFGKLQQQQQGPNYNGSAKYSVLSFGIPTHVSPAAIAAHFPHAANHFPSSQLITTRVPIDRDEATRFDVLRARRAAIAPYDNARHEAATFRRMDYVRRDIMNQQRAELKRHEKISAARERKDHVESANNFGIPSHVSIAGIAAHFPYASSHFPMGGQSKVPIAFEEAHRFDGLAARRQALASREAERFDGAAERREAILVHRQSILQDKGRLRQEGVEKAKARKDKLFADAMIAQKQMQGQQQQIPQQTNQREITQKLSPVTAALGGKLPTTLEEKNVALMFWALPDTIVMADVERHFPNAASRMHEFETSKDGKKLQEKDLKKSIPRDEEEAHRFDLVPIRRSAIALRDQRRQKDSVTRGLATVETRRFVAKNESLLRSKRIYSKENAGWVNAVGVTTSAVKDVKEHGTWSNVKAPDQTTVIVDSKASAHVDSKAYTTEATGTDAIVQQQQAPVAGSAAAAASAPAAETKNKTVVHASQDETGKPLVNEADIVAAAAKNSSNKEVVVVADSQAPANSNNSEKNNSVPVHKATDTKVKSKKFCC